MYNILIVDDESGIRSIVRKYGEFEGHKVTEASDGMQAVELCRNNKFDILINVVGGGLNGQAAACLHGLSRALTRVDPNCHTALKANGYLTRDSRMVERKKYGQRGARRRFQFSKR